MYAIAFVFLLLLAAAGLWHGGRALFSQRRGPAWLSRAVDQRGQWVVLVALIPILALIALGASAVMLLLLR